jgi:hypothetical protein
MMLITIFSRIITLTTKCLWSWYDTQTWGSLHKAWLGYVIAKSKGEYDKQLHYASIIQKLQELDLDVSSFLQLGNYNLEVKYGDDNEAGFYPQYGDPGGIQL